MKKRETKFIDFDLFLFYFSLAIFSSIIYIIRQPFISINKKEADFFALFGAYFVDLIIFFSVLLSYLIILISLFFKKVLKGIKVSDSVIVILFFPLLSLFIKGMSMVHVYTEISIKEIVLNNYIFLGFNIVGPLLVFGHKLVLNFKKRRNF